MSEFERAERLALLLRANDYELARQAALRGHDIERQRRAEDEIRQCWKRFADIEGIA